MQADGLSLSPPIMNSTDAIKSAILYDFPIVAPDMLLIDRNYYYCKSFVSND